MTYFKVTTANFVERWHVCTPAIRWIYQKVYILNVIVGTFYQYLPYFQKKKIYMKNVQY